MTLAMCAHITFPARDGRAAFAIRKVSEVVVEQSLEQMVQSCTITLPRNIRVFADGKLNDLLRRNDKVVVQLGYNDVLFEEFTGYIVRVGADIPVVIEVRDEMHQLMQRTVNKSYKDAFLPTVIEDIVGPGVKVVANEVSIGALRLEKCSAGRALKQLKDDFGFVTYYRDGTVYCGLRNATDAPTVRYVMEQNIKRSDLVFRSKDDVKLLVEATSLKKDGSKLSVKVGDEDGELRSVPHYGVTSEAELRKLALIDLEKFKYDGFEGSFKTFGLPFIQFGHKVDLSSKQYRERDGQYLAEAVKTTWGKDGFERNITLAQRWL